MKICFLLIPFIFLSAVAAEKKMIRCGIALGYPPYQYQTKLKTPAGMDYEIAKEIFHEAGLDVQFIQRNWDDVLLGLMHKTGEIDALCGIEVGPERLKYLDFSTPYNNRKIVLFVLKKSKYSKVSDLFNKFVTGDRHSSFERFLGKDRGQIRVIGTKTKEESFQMLKEGKVQGVIAPLEVGYYVAHKLHLDVHSMHDDNAGTPVSIAVSKGNSELITKLNRAIGSLLKNGKIQKLVKKKYE